MVFRNASGAAFNAMQSGVSLYSTLMAEVIMPFLPGHNSLHSCRQQAEQDPAGTSLHWTDHHCHWCWGVSNYCCNKAVVTEFIDEEAASGVQSSS